MTASSWSRRAVLLLLFVFSFGFFLPATRANAQTPTRIAKPVDNNVVVRIPGSKHPLAQVTNDRGPVDGNLPMRRMLLLLSPSAQQQAALSAFLNRVHDKGSGDYQQWLTPAQFGAQFGPAQADIDRISGWLATQGFTTDAIAAGRQWIEFSGTAAQVERAFHTEMHHYSVKGEVHIANATDVSIPAALVPVVRGVLSLNDFRKHAMHERGFTVHRDASTGKLRPNFTLPTSNGDFHFIAPGDFSRIYNTLPLLNAGTDGAGTSIAIVARSNIQLSDVQTFRQIFGLPTNDPVFIFNGPDPGQVDEVEAALDTQWSGAVAPRATIKLVITGSTFTSDGSDLSMAYIVDHRVAPIMSSSFGQCEAFLGPMGNAFFNSAYEQAAAEGITVFVSSGDNGAAGCDPPISLFPAQGGLNVNGLASTPFNIAVGGTQFDDAGRDANFWLPNNRADLSSAIGYVPEKVWNETCDPTTDANQCGDGLFSLFASAGGQSSCVDSEISGNSIVCLSGYPKPSWQAGSTIPNDHVRDLPDVSLNAAGNHDGYLICVEGTCQTTTVDGQTVLENAFVVGGTSASTPSMAGIMALVEQRRGDFQGLANFNFYQLAAGEDFSSCDSSLLTNPLQPTNCIFQDTTAGNNSVPGLTGFNAAPGFDFATGLGSINAAELVDSWTSAQKLATQTSLTAGATVSQHGQALPINVAVAPVGANGAPSGDFDLFAGSVDTVLGGTLSQGAFAGSVNTLPGGQYQLTAHYGGDPMFASSDSNSVALKILPEPSTVTLTGFEINLGGFVVPLQKSVLYGEPVALQFNVAGASGIGSATGSVTLFDNKSPLGTFPLNEGGNGFAQIDNLTVTGLLTGHHAITATYSGDNSFLPSGSGSVAFKVDKQLARGFIFPVPDTATAGAPVRFLLSVLAEGQEPPSGTVQVFDNGKRVGNALTLAMNGELGAGTPQVELTQTFTAGDHEIAFTYSGDKNFNSFSLKDFNAGDVDVQVQAAAGGAVVIHVQQSPATVSLAQTANYQVTVMPASAGGVVPTGTVSLVGPNGFVFAPDVALNNGTATLPLTFDAAGPFEIAASYSGDSHYSPFSSSILTTNVGKGTPTVTLGAQAAAVAENTQTSFLVSVVGDPAMPSISTPFGFVQFFDSLNGGAQQPLGTPQALTVGNGGNPVFALPVVLKPGQHVVRAEYLGSADWAATFSNSASVVVGGN